MFNIQYNAETFGGHGGGGEYGVQKGFGWTNGVIIEFLNKYGSEISVSNSGNNDGGKFANFNNKNPS